MKSLKGKTYNEICDMFPDGFLVTGTLRNGKRFSIKYSSSIAGLSTSLGINLWRGSVWGVKDGKKTLIKRVWN
jgi:hypothetical protein